MCIEVIIPAYNEASVIGAVVAAARACPLVERVHVVDDGSWDRTAEMARQAGAHVHVLASNQGKTAAILKGVEETTAAILVLLDGDLLGIEPVHIEHLAAPVLAGEAAMSVGVFKDGRWATNLSQSLTPFLNGQRALRRELLHCLRGYAHRRYAADTLLSLYTWGQKLPVRMVPLPGLTHIMKEEKIGWVQGFFSRLNMFYQVFLAFFAYLDK